MDSARSSTEHVPPKPSRGGPLFALGALALLAAVLGPFLRSSYERQDAEIKRLQGECETLKDRAAARELDQQRAHIEELKEALNRERERAQAPARAAADGERAKAEEREGRAPSGPDLAPPKRPEEEAIPEKDEGEPDKQPNPPPDPEPDKEPEFQPETALVEANPPPLGVEPSDGLSPFPPLTGDAPRAGQVLSFLLKEGYKRPPPLLKSKDFADVQQDVQKLDRLFDQAMSRALQGTVDRSTLGEVRRVYGPLRDHIQRLTRAGRVQTHDYQQALRFLELMRDACRILENPGQAFADIDG